MIHWKLIDEFIEPNWEKVPVPGPPTLFWRGKKDAAVFGYIRDGELFDYKWLYVCDSNKVTHFSEVNGPESNVVEMEGARPAAKSTVHANYREICPSSLLPNCPMGSRGEPLVQNYFIFRASLLSTRTKVCQA